MLDEKDIELLSTWFVMVLQGALNSGITEEQIITVLTTKNVKAGLKILKDIKCLNAP